MNWQFKCTNRLAKACYGLAFLLLSSLVHAQMKPRVVNRMNEGWQFRKDDNASWQNIQLPHTWNIEDVIDNFNFQKYA